MTEVHKFIVASLGGIAAIIIGILGLTDPPILALGELSFVFIIGGFAVLGVPLKMGYNDAQFTDAVNLAKEIEANHQG